MKLSKWWFVTGVFLFIGLSLTISAHKSFWRDEAFSVLVAQHPITEVITITANDFSPPLFYLLLHFWLKGISTNDTALRLLPLGFGLFTLGLWFYYVHLMIKEFTIRKVPVGLQSWFWIGMIPLASLSPVWLYFSSELRTYSLFIFLVLLSSLLAYRFSLSGKLRYCFSLMVVNTLTLYTHSVGLIWVGSLTATVAGWLWLHQQKRVIKPYLLSILGLGLMSLPWIQVLYRQSQQAQKGFWITFDYWDSLLEYRGLFIGVEGRSHEPVYQAFIGVSVFLTLLGLSVVCRYYRRMLIVIAPVGLALLGVYLTSVIVSPVLYQRYVTFLSPLVLLLISYGLGFILIVSKKWYYLVYTAYLILNCLLVYDLIHHSTGTDYRPLANLANLPVYTEEVLDIMPCMYYHPQCYFVGDPSKTAFHVGTVQVADAITHIDSWERLGTDNLGVLYRQELKETIKATLTDQGFKEQAVSDLGEGVKMGIWRRRASDFFGSAIF